MNNIQTKQKEKVKTIDWAAILAKPLDEKPKSLVECLEEAGGFPFGAVAVTGLPPGSSPEHTHPIGDEILVTEIVPGRPDRYEGVSSTLGGIAIKNTIKRWKLLGHL